jgi:signal transduction histidine kinase
LGSLRVRLLAAWAVFILLAVQIAAVGLTALFERSITRRTLAELNFDLDQLTKALRVQGSGVLLTKRGPTDPQFEVFDGGRYWQVLKGNVLLLSSASLGGRKLDIARYPTNGDVPAVASLIAPDHKPLVAVVRSVDLRSEPGADLSGHVGSLQIVSAVNASEIKEDAAKFSSDLLTSLAGVALLLMTGAWIHVTIGLRPLKNISASLSRIRAGQSNRIEGTFPDEVRPLVDETNGLLEALDMALQTARARASDLAHGLKTPLAIMAAKSRHLRSTGAAAVADDIDQQIEMMRRHVQRELARARARGGSRAVHDLIDACEVTRELVSAIQVLPRARVLDWELEADTKHLLPVDRADFNDILGNLLDNAQKWAQSRVAVRVEGDEAAVWLFVDDDGPGVAEHDIDRISMRGVKADSTRDGSGLGLAIVGDLVELYRGSFKLGRSKLGGLRVSVMLPGP